MATTRGDVYRAIDGERKYQDSKWNPETTPSGGQHSVGAWLTFMRVYLRQAEEQLTGKPDPEASDQALHTIRKVAAMAVACMEQNGVKTRA